MYIDKDNNGRYLLADLTTAELEAIRRALISHRTGILSSIHNADDSKISECEKQYRMAGKLLQIIERK